MLRGFHAVAGNKQETAAYADCEPPGFVTLPDTGPFRSGKRNPIYKHIGCIFLDSWTFPPSLKKWSFRELSGQFSHGCFHFNTDGSSLLQNIPISIIRYLMYAKRRPQLEAASSRRLYSFSRLALKAGSSAASIKRKAWSISSWPSGLPVFAKAKPFLR